MFLSAEAFHPWKLSKYIARRHIPIRVVASYLLDPLWLRADREEPDGTHLGAPCDDMHGFNDFFLRPARLPARSPASEATGANTSALEAVPFCYPAFAHHWHNHWRSRLRKTSAAFQVEEWLHRRLSLPAPSAQAYRGPWGHH